MGTYIYKVTNQIVISEDGKKANLAVFAYKPVWSSWDFDMNWRLAAKAKCYIAEKYVKTSKNYTGRVVMEEGGPAIECNRGVFNDDWFYDQVSKQNSTLAA